MKRLLSKCGYIVYKCTLAELVELTGGYGVCDMCNTPNKEMYLVPVLNSAMCPQCYDDWNNRAIYYEDDIPFQNAWNDRYVRMAKVNNIRIEKDV